MPKIALTFDDGPGPATPLLLDVLAARKFPATFFLLGMTVANEWRVGVLVDEAHNLLPRARAMYSAELDPAALHAALAAAPAAVAAPLRRLRRVWDEVAERS